MLKGHVFSKQIFGNPIFALFINTFLNGQNGVSNNYKNGMAVTYSGSTVTVDSGAVCIQGRFLEEDISTTISAGTDNSYCKLVIEIDLDKQNTDTEFLQGTYKIIKSGTGYPTLTQTDIVKNDAGVYQYELARFITNAGGISEFSDRRTFLDFESIYATIQEEYSIILEQLKEELKNVEDGSAYLLKEEKETLLDNSNVIVELIKIGGLCTIIACSKRTLDSSYSYNFNLPDYAKPKNSYPLFNRQAHIEYADNTGTEITGYSNLFVSSTSSYFNITNINKVHQHYYNSISYYIEN